MAWEEKVLEGLVSEITTENFLKVRKERDTQERNNVELLVDITRTFLHHIVIHRSTVKYK